MIAIISRLVGVPAPVVWLGLAFIATTTFFGAKALYDRNQQAIGGEKQLKKTIGETNAGTKKLEVDADLGELSFDECLDRGMHYNFENNRCG